MRREPARKTHFSKLIDYALEKGFVHKFFWMKFAGIFGCGVRAILA